MSYTPALIEWFFWLAPYIMLAVLVWVWWNRMTSLRAYHIRSIATFTMVFVVAYSLGRFRDEGMPWHDPMWLLSVIGMAALALIAWNADRLRLKFSEFELQTGQRSQADKEQERE